MMEAFHRQYQMHKLHSILRFAFLHLIRDANRNLLCVIAIAIGMAAVVALSIVSRSAAAQAIDAYKDMSIDLFTMTVPARNQNFDGGPSLQRHFNISSEDDVSVLQRTVQSALASYDPALKTQSTVHAMQISKCQLVSKDLDQTLQFATAAPNLLGHLGFTMAEGRDWVEHDGATAWVVMGAKIAKSLREHGGLKLRVGKPFQLCDATYFLAGILRETAERQNDEWQETVFVLPSTFKLKKSRLESVDIVAKLPPTVNIEKIIPYVSAYLGMDEFSPITIKSAAKMIELRKQHIEQYSKLIFLVGAISVLVGGLAVMNVMQMSILERRYDIAVCIAVGADKMAIFMQFFIESLALGLAGGVLGGILGVLLSYGILAWQGMPAVGWFDVVVGAGALSAIVGAASGLHPSLKVSRTDPAIVLAS